MRRAVWSLFALTAILASGSAAVRAIAEDASCRRCLGKKELACKRCRGFGKTASHCETCKGIGVVACTATGCSDGVRRCRACKGAGQRGERVIPVGGQPYTRRIRCGRCRGGGVESCDECKEGARGCSDCAQRGQIDSPCPECESKGKRPCDLCNGSGKQPPRPLPETIVARYRELGRRVVTVEQKLAKKQPDVESLVTSLTAARARKSELAAHIEEAQKGADAFSDALESSTRALGAQLERYGQILARLETAVDELRALADERTERFESLAALSARIDEHAKANFTRDGPSPYDTLSKLGDEIDVHERYLTQLGAKSREAERRLGSIGDTPERILTSAERLRQRAAELRSEADAEARRENTLAAQLAFAKQLLPATAASFGLPAPTAVELDGDSDPDSLRVRLVLSDEAGEVAESVETATPREELLASVPAFVSKAFERVPHLIKLRVELHCPVLSETGHRRLREVQSFAFQRSKWKELVTGVYREDWKELLARSSPKPEFPRAGGFVMDSFFGRTLPVICVVAVVALVLLRLIRMLLSG